MLGQPDASVLKGMNRLQAHRGPDGHGIFIDDNCGLAHTRLSIVDLAGSEQPIYSDNSTVVVANGEIYNYLELRAGLKNYQWKTSGDSEVILALHASSNKLVGDNPALRHRNWVSQLDGMFAFALWDSKERELVLARDAVGIKPLVRTLIDGKLLFSSEVKALRAHEEHVPRIDNLALAARLAWEYPLDGTTLLDGVVQVRAGTIETWTLDSMGNAIQTGYCSFSRQVVLPAESWSPIGGAEELLESFVTDVSDRLMSDVPLGIVLSGGLDSSLVAAVAEEAAVRASQPVPECWTVAESEDNPDWIAAELVANSLDLKHHKHILDPDLFHSRLPDLSWHGEDLDVSVLFFQPLFSKMAQTVKVGLCGQGADELHAGYPRYRNLAEHAKVVESRLAQIEHPEAQPLLTGKLPVGDEWWQADHRANCHTDNLAELLQFEMEHGQLSNFQLRLVDRHSMAHGLEVRVPFLGQKHRLLSNSLPLEWRLPEGAIIGQEKAALRCAADLTGLPKEIIHRPKLPAGTATSPTLIRQLLDELEPRAKQIAKNFQGFEKVLARQPDMALGLGLFQAIHIQDGGRAKPNRQLVDLLDEVL